jgi:NADPH:quinone reductase-like Zn-dependent oxidoreductase
VQLSGYGGVEVLAVIRTPPAGIGRALGPEEVLVQVVTAGINPGEIAIREGAMATLFPTEFPSGQGSDFAGRVIATGPDVTGFAVGDEVLGWSDSRSAQADIVVSDIGHLTAKPLALDWIRAGGLWAIGVTSWAAVRAVAPQPGETVMVSGATGGVGNLAAQLALQAGARVIGVAGAHNQARLRERGITPMPYGPGLADRLRVAAPQGIDAVIDAHGGGYVDLAIDLGVAPARIDTVIDFEAARRHGTFTDASPEGGRPEVLAAMAAQLAAGELSMPIAAIYPLAKVADAYTDLSGGHVDGKIVLSMELPDSAPPVRLLPNPITKEDEQ